MDNDENLALDDERRVKVLSPSALVIRRFLRNRLAIVGFAVIIFMFLFSFVGPLFSPYSEYQVFTADQRVSKDFASASSARSLRFTSAEGTAVSGTLSGAASTAILSGSTSFSSGGLDYNVEAFSDELFIINALSEAAVYNTVIGQIQSTADVAVSGADFEEAVKDAISENADKFTFNDSDYYLLKQGKNISVRTEKPVAMASYYVYNAYEKNSAFSYEFKLEAEKILSQGGGNFNVNGREYKIGSVDGNAEIYVLDAQKDEYIPFAALSEAFIQATGDVFIGADVKKEIENAIKNGNKTLELSDGTVLEISGENGVYKIKSDTETQVISVYSAPSPEHLLGTDANGMDILTRLMYGGRISLIIGFIVVFIETLIGVVLGGIAGFFGGVWDNIIMRLVDIFNCIPTLPLFIIIGAIMDGLKLDPSVRIYMLMLILGIFSWPGIARLVRGQILSLREQEFMLATEAIGIKTGRRIFRHLIPNVIPQLIVMATMGLGSIILTESTLSFFGLGVKYPFASWGNIINAVTSIQVMTNYLFVWIPAGLCILLTVLGFNFIGDGLRDAFDPKMKR